MQGKTAMECVQIASAGGGMTIDGAHRTTMELVQIAAAAARSSASIEIKNSQFKTTMELVQIASAGKGCVRFS